MSPLMRATLAAAKPVVSCPIDRLIDRLIVSSTTSRFPHVSARSASVPDGTHPWFRGDAPRTLAPIRHRADGAERRRG